MEKENKKAEWKQQYQKRKGYFKEYYQKNKDVMDANNKKNAKKYREAYKSFREGKKAELEKRVEELERLVREIIQWKEDRIIIQIDKNGKEVGEAIHNYHIDEAKYEGQFENGMPKYKSDLFK